MSKRVKKKKSKSSRPSFIKSTPPRTPDLVKFAIQSRRAEEELSEGLKILEDYKKEVRNETTRRIIKIMCLSLNEKYGFGKKRAATLVYWMSDLIDEELKTTGNNTKEFWKKVDEKLESLEMNFFPSEEDIVSQENK